MPRSRIQRKVSDAKENSLKCADKSQKELRRVCHSCLTTKIKTQISLAATFGILCKSISEKGRYTAVCPFWLEHAVSSALLT